MIQVKGNRNRYSDSGHSPSAVGPSQPVENQSKARKPSPVAESGVSAITTTNWVITQPAVIMAMANMTSQRLRASMGRFSPGSGDAVLHRRLLHGYAKALYLRTVIQ